MYYKEYQQGATATVALETKVAVVTMGQHRLWRIEVVALTVRGESGGSKWPR
jgi:hypothetical protein